MPAPDWRDRKPIEDANRARVRVEHLAEIRLTQPRVDVEADLEAQLRGHHFRSSETPDEIHLSVAALAEQPLDAIAELLFPGSRRSGLA